MASRTYNHVVLVGRLGADPQLRSITSGKSVCSFNLATNRVGKDKTEITDWHRIEMWDNLADIASKFLKKGSSILVEGRVQNENYEKNGVKQYSYKIVASNFMMLDAKKSDETRSFQVNESKQYEQTPNEDFDSYDQPEDKGSYDTHDIDKEEKGDDVPF